MLCCPDSRDPCITVVCCSPGLQHYYGRLLCGGLHHAVLYLLAAVLQPGFYAASITPGSRAITAAAVCPQGFFCGGGLPVNSFDPSDPTALSATEPSIRLCSHGTLTKELGSTSEAQCCKSLCQLQLQGTCHVKFTSLLCRRPATECSWLLYEHHASLWYVLAWASMWMLHLPSSQ
jgi:hypothetical protein